MILILCISIQLGIYEIKEVDSISIYSIKPGATLPVWNNIGGLPNAKELPFDCIAFISGTDTTILNGKEKIINYLKRGEKQGDYLS